MWLRVFALVIDILFYRKGLADKILKDKERERELVAQKEKERLTIGDEDKGRKRSRYIRSVSYPTWAGF